MADAVAVVRKRKVYELVAAQRQRRARGELGVPRHLPRRRCDSKMVVPAVRPREEHKQLLVTVADVVRVLSEWCCNQQCGAALVSDAAVILDRRGEHHLKRYAVDRRAHLALEMARGYYVPLLLFPLVLFFSIPPNMVVVLAGR